MDDWAALSPPGGPAMGVFFFLGVVARSEKFCRYRDIIYSLRHQIG